MAENLSQPQGANPPSRRGLYLPFIGLALVIALWTGIWFYAAGKAGTIVDHLIAREGERGRNWICPDRQIGGFPFRIEMSCAKPQLILKGEEGLRPAGSLGRLAVHARILSPGHFVAELAPPFLARQGDDGDVELTWKEGNVSVIAGLESISEASVKFSDLKISAGQGTRRDVSANAKGFELHLRRSAGDVPGTDLVTQLLDFSFSPLDKLIGSPDPIRLEVQATAPGFIPDPKRRFVEAVEAWRAGGHQARIVVLKATKGQANLDLSGVMGLDGLHRLEGNLQGRAKGLEALTNGLTRRGGLDLGGLFGKMGGGQGLPVALVFGNGQLRFGPFPLTRLDPLY